MNIPQQFSPETLRSGILGPMNLPWKDALGLARARSLPARSTLVLHGAELLDFYYLAHGRIRLMHSAEDGCARSMLRIGPGNLFNEATALAGFDAPDCCFYCLQTCEIFRFPGRLLHDAAFVSSHPELITNLMISLATKLLVMHVGLSTTAGTSALRRLCRYFLSLSRRNGDALEFAPGLTQDELATFLGLHRATVVRALGELRRKGAIVRFTKRQMRIGDMELLRSLAR